MSRFRKLPREAVKVTVWSERDRLCISIVDRATEQLDVATWWDDDARSMFDAGFFESGRNLERSVIDYAVAMQMVAA